MFLKEIEFKKNIVYESKRKSQRKFFKVRTKTTMVKNHRKRYYDDQNNEIIPVEKVTEKLFTIFKKGFTMQFNPLTIIVGDNGCGKTSLINNIKFPYDKLRNPFITDMEGYQRDVMKEYIQNDKRILKFSNQPKHIIVENELHKLSIINNYESFSRKGNFLPSDKLLGVWDMNEFSNGENILDLLQGLKTIKDSLIVLDEPETSLSIKSQYRIKQIISELLAENNQVILITHSEVLMSLVNEVYDFEKKVYVDTNTYIEQQKTI